MHLSAVDTGRHRKDFHFCRLFPGDDFSVSLARHEHYLCSRLQLRPGNNVLLIGCGSGDIAFELLNYAGVDVVGIDEDPEKVGKRSISRNRDDTQIIKFTDPGGCSKGTACKSVRTDAICDDWDRKYGKRS